MFLLKIYFRFHVFLSFFANFFANNKQNKSNGLDSAKPGQAPHIKFPKKDSLLFKPAKSNYETRLKRFSIIKLQSFITLFETENKWQKTKPVPIPLPRASRNFPDVKTRNIFFLRGCQQVV